MKLSKKTMLSFFACTTTLLLGFQNCGDTSFSTTPTKVVDAACNVANGCASAASLLPATEPTPSQQPTSQVLPSSTTTSSSLYNFVAGDKATCEASIVSRLGRGASCTIGGGCGLSCGMPGSNCTSANPNHWGACINPEAWPAPVASAPTLYNFVAGDKATCEASILSRLGTSASCSIGGGCGLSCGMTGPNCPSANPTHWGACISH